MKPRPSTFIIILLRILTTRMKRTVRRESRSFTKAQIFHKTFYPSPSLTSKTSISSSTQMVCQSILISKLEAIQYASYIFATTHEKPLRNYLLKGSNQKSQIWITHHKCYKQSVRKMEFLMEIFCWQSITLSFTNSGSFLSLIDCWMSNFKLKFYDSLTFIFIFLLGTSLVPCVPGICQLSFLEHLLLLHTVFFPFLFLVFDLFSHLLFFSSLFQMPPYPSP